MKCDDVLILKDGHRSDAMDYFIGSEDKENVLVALPCYSHKNNFSTRYHDNVLP